tara:strand:- start:820 stop:1062 length:243 start_codon:yes stop_codon:yes gene_type:complete
MTDTKHTYSYVFHPKKGWSKIKIIQPKFIDLNTLATKDPDKIRKNNPKKLTEYLRNKWNRQKVNSIAFDNAKSLKTMRYY